MPEQAGTKRESTTPILDKMSPEEAIKKLEGIILFFNTTHTPGSQNSVMANNIVQQLLFKLKNRDKGYFAQKQKEHLEAVFREFDKGMSKFGG